MAFSITFQSALQRSMYAGESLIWEKSAPGLERYFSEFRDRDAKCKQSDSPEMHAQISATFSKECNLISDDIQLRLYRSVKILSSLTLDNLMTSRNLV